MYYIVQVMTIFIAAGMAEHDAVAANNFSFYGATPEQQKQFHSANSWTKFFICLGFSLLILFNRDSWFLNYFFDAIIAGVSCGLWFFLIFDPVLNKARKNGLNWDYISNNDATGKWLLKHFGERAGQIKAVACLILIAGLNVLYLCL